MSTFQRITLVVILCVVPSISSADNRLFTSTSTIEFFIRGMARIYDVPEDVAVYIAKAESNFNIYALGDKNMSRGLWQIHRKYNPDMDDAESYSVVSSTIWAMEQMAEGKFYLWTTYSKYVKMKLVLTRR